MSTKIAVGIPTIVYNEGLEKAVAYIREQTLKTDIFVVCNSHRVIDTVNRLVESEGIIASFPDHNLGVSASWNLLIQAGYDAGYDSVLIIGDDIELIEKDTLEKFQNAVETNDKAVYFVYDRGFSAFCIPRTVFEEIGVFDEGFWPGYFEDNDYYRRMMLAGIGWQGLFIETNHYGSASINMDENLKALNAALFPFNRQRYVEKWGGWPHSETFTIPYNGNQASPDVGGDRR